MSDPNEILMMVCRKHGVYNIKFRDLVCGNRCDLCKKEVNNYLYKVNEIHNNKYIYDHIKMIDYTKNISIKCQTQGWFTILPVDHLMCGCNLCEIANNSTKKTIPTPSSSQTPSPILSYTPTTVHTLSYTSTPKTSPISNYTSEQIRTQSSLFEPTPISKQTSVPTLSCIQRKRKREEITKDSNNKKCKFEEYINKEYKCHTCGKKFITKHGMNVHESTIHKIVPIKYIILGDDDYNKINEMKKINENKNNNKNINVKITKTKNNNKKNINVKITKTKNNKNKKKINVKITKNNKNKKNKNNNNINVKIKKTKNNNNNNNNKNKNFNLRSGSGTENKKNLKDSEHDAVSAVEFSNTEEMK